MPRITDYGALGTVASDDVVPIVDVHDFAQSGTGSTKKITVTNLLAGSPNAVDWINVTKAPYSADPTGTADSTAAIQAAINAGTGPVYLPAGVYKISSPLTLANGTVIQGASGGGYGGAFPPGVSEILLANASNCSMILAPSTANYWKLKNLLLSGNGSAQSGPTQTGSTGAAIHIADAGASAECQGELGQVYVQSAYNDALYLGVNRRAVHARRCKFINAGTNNTTYGAGNGVTCVYSDHVLDGCQIGGNHHHGVYLAGSPVSSIRITSCDIFTNGQDWASVTPTTVAAGSNGQTVSGLTGVGVLNVASTSGFPATGSLWINVSSGPVAVSYTGTSGGNQFTGVAVSATQGNQGGTLATAQGVYLFGGNAVHIGSATAGVWVSGNSLDRNNGCGVFTETSPNDIHIVGNRFLSNGQAATALLPHIMLTSPNAQTSIVGNGMEPVAGGFTAQCTNFIYSNGAGTGWLDAANAWLFAQLSTSAYTNSFNGLQPFSAGTFIMQGTAAKVTSQILQASSQTADLMQFQDSTGSHIPLYAIDAWARPVVTSTAATKPAVAVGAAAGTGSPSAAIINGDAAGNLSVTLGTTPTTGILVTVTFAHAYVASTTPVVTLTPQNADAAKINSFIYVTPTNTAWTVNVATGVSYTGTTNPIWNYSVTGT